jgi:hypothetical protein
MPRHHSGAGVVVKHTLAFLTDGRTDRRSVQSAREQARSSKTSKNIEILLLCFFQNNNSSGSAINDGSSSIEGISIGNRVGYATTCHAPLAPDDISYTLVTQLSTNRLWMMEYHCQR